MITVKQAVQNGIALLDAKGPKDWRELVDVDFLNVASLSRCPLGQIYGQYSNGMTRLFGDFNDSTWEAGSTRHGFEAPINGDGLKDYSAITAEWIRVLSKV